MLHLYAPLVFFLIACATAAQAVDVDLSMTTTAGYDDNVFRTSSHEDDDATFRFGPTIRFRDLTDTLTYNVSYNPVYEVFATYDEANDLSHFAHGALQYQLSDLTTFHFSEDFRLVQSLNQGPLVANEDAVGNDINFVPETEVRREDVYRNTAMAWMVHNFSASTQGEFTISHDYFNSDVSNTSTNNSVTGYANLMHALSASDRIGLGGGTTWQRFDSVQGQPQTDSFIFRLMASWIHNFGQDTELTVRAGPAVIYTDQANGKTRFGDQYPHVVVPTARTIAQAYAAIGQSVPTNVQDLDGNPLAGSTMIAAGSVLIPEDTSCLSVMVNGQPVFDRSPCRSYSVVVDSAGPYGAVATSISSAAQIPLNYVSGNDGVSDTRITGFGEVTLSHFWIPELSSTASYVRTDSGATSLGSSTISDSVYLENVWTPTRRWDLSVRGDWVRRKSATDVLNTYVVIAPDAPPVAGSPSPIVSNTGLVADTFHDSVDTEYWRVAGRIAYRTSRRSTVSLRAFFQHQDTERASTRSNSTFDNFQVMLGFRYDLDPFHF
ncbi:MAG TPA: hypothetical protein VEC18_00875 [Myxococcota bacterium]|nr:hypothetical protein [Myxococcota bacterium]